MEIAVSAFSRRFDRSAFDCGISDLNNWLQQYSGQNERRHTSRTFVVTSDTNHVIAYYSTRTCQLAPDEVASTLGVGNHPYPIPAILVTRLAVDKRMQGSGLGSSLFVRYLQRLESISHDVGFEVIVVASVNKDASVFNRKFSFIPFVDSPARLYLTTKDLRQTFAAS